MIGHLAVWPVGPAAAACCPVAAADAPACEELNVPAKGADKLPHAYPMRRVGRQYEQRRREVDAALRSPKAPGGRLQHLHRGYRRIIGQMPDKTPQDAKLTGVFRCEGHRIEKVICQSIWILPAGKRLQAPTKLVRPTRERTAALGFNEWFRAQDGGAPRGQDRQTWPAAMYLYAATRVGRGGTPLFKDIRGRPQAGEQKQADVETTPAAGDDL